MITLAGVTDAARAVGMPQVECPAPCFLLVPVHDGTGQVLDLGCSWLNGAARALARAQGLGEAPGGRALAARGLLAYDEALRVAQGALASARLAVRLGRPDGESFWRAVLQREGPGVALWLFDETEVRRGERRALAALEGHRRAERTLQGREQQLRLALETAGMVAWEWTRERGMVHWSAHAEAFFGLPPGGLGTSLHSFLALVHPEDREETANAIDLGLSGTGPYSFRFRARGAEGGLRSYEATGQTFRDGGRATHMVGVVVDTTERERAERRLREAEERYRLAAWATHDALWEWNLETGQVHWGEASAAVLGYAHEAMGGELAWWREQVHPDDRERATASLLALVQGPHDYWREEYRFRRGDGVYLDVLDRGVMVRDTEGRPLRMIGMMMDITERKRTLERMALEAAFRERFIGILGHDLRTPLNAVTLASGTLAHPERLSHEQVRRLAHRMEASAARMAGMIADLLDFTRARLAGGIPLVLGEVQLPRLCQAVMEEVAAAHPGRAVELRCEGAAAGVWDGERLAQVLSNLVVNALEHSPPEAAVRVRCYPQGPWQLLEVHNEGPPIPAEALPFLFEPFRQADSVRERGGGRHAGLGLGLFIVREIARAHGGDAEVCSSAEEGTTFTVRLPHEAPGAREAARAAGAQAP